MPSHMAHRSTRQGAVAGRRRFLRCAHRSFAATPVAERASAACPPSPQDVLARAKRQSLDVERQLVSPVGRCGRCPQVGRRPLAGEIVGLGAAKANRSWRGTREGAGERGWRAAKSGARDQAVRGERVGERAFFVEALDDRRSLLESIMARPKRSATSAATQPASVGNRVVRRRRQGG